MVRRILIIDMTSEPVSRNRSLQFLDVALSIAMFFFFIGSALGVATTPSTLGSGGIGLDATVEPKLEARVARSLAPDVPFKIERASVHVNVHVPARDHDSRRVIAVGFLVAIAMGWIGLLSLRAVVKSAREGNPFDPRNVRRLRRLGLVVLAVPVLVGLVNRLLERSIDSQVVHARIAHVDALPSIVIALGVLALAEVFREGAALRELEQSTI
jgi:hypothetical protein